MKQCFNPPPLVKAETYPEGAPAISSREKRDGAEGFTACVRLPPARVSSTSFELSTLSEIPTAELGYGVSTRLGKLDTLTWRCIRRGRARLEHNLGYR